MRTVTAYRMGCDGKTKDPIDAESRQEGTKMLQTLAAILLVLWGLGLVTSYTMGGFIHILLVIAVVEVLIHVVQARKAVQRPWRTFRGRVVARR